MNLPVAVIGNGAAAAEAVIALRENGFVGDIHVFADNDHAPYNPMLGTYLVAGKIPLEQAFPFGDHRAFYEANRVTFHASEPVTEIDAVARTMHTSLGATHSYDNCLVASGARPAVPPVAGLREALVLDAAQESADSANLHKHTVPAGGDERLPRRIFTIQTLGDVQGLKMAAETVCTTATREPQAAVVGASFAGVKIASVLHDMGMHVTFIEREPSILPLSAHPDCARLLERHLREEGYQLRLGAALSAVSPQATGVRLDFGSLPGAAQPGGMAGGTACEDGEAQQEVDLVVVCTGNRPSLSFMKPGQVDIGTGILVNDDMRSSIPTLYAAGDVAQGKNLLSGRHEIIGLWASARLQGRAAGRSMAGAPAEYRGGVPNNITHVGNLLFASVGCLREYDQIEISDGNGSHDGATLAGQHFELRAWQEGRLVGVNYVGRCLDVGVAKHALLKAAIGATQEMEATWTKFNG